MRPYFASIVSGAVFIASLTATSATFAGDATILGTGIGAAIGGLFGSQIGHGTGQMAATGAGVAVGGLIGNDIGHQIDAERSAVYSSAGPNGYAVYSDPSPIVYAPYAPNYVAPPAPPPPTYVDPQAGTYCREYSQEIRIDGRLQESYGTACLQPDGSWRIVQ